jgi:pentatricopeptide repeat protein
LLYQRRKNTPDHGENFVPGSESAPSNRNPQSLDHFKRGYRERAHLRDRDTSTLNEDFRRGNRGSYNNSEPHRPQGGGRYIDRGSNSSRQGGYNDRRSSGGDRGDDRGRGQVIMGLDVQALVDRLCRNNNDVFKLLDAARDEHNAVFQSGKAVTAIISNLARRRNLRLANIVWDWIDSVGIEKNTFHYNSMISVCEKVRDFRKALKLLDEMKDKKVTKNEVT